MNRARLKLTVHYSSSGSWLNFAATGHHVDDPASFLSIRVSDLWSTLLHRRGVGGSWYVFMFRRPEEPCESGGQPRLDEVEFEMFK